MIKNEELWSLDVTIAKFIYPRLEKLKEVTHGYPSDLYEAYGEDGFVEWQKILDKMIYSFKVVASDEFWDLDSLEEVQEGIDYFAKYYLSLWD